MHFGKGPKPAFEIKVDASPIPWVDCWDYLGVCLKSGDKFGCCVKNKLSSFYRALNSIIRIEGRSDELVMLRLLKARCLPILTYGIEIIYVKDGDERRQLRVAYNSIFSIIFHYSYRESVTALQHALHRPTWEELLEKCKGKFLNKCRDLCDSTLVRSLCSL